MMVDIKKKLQLLVFGKIASFGSSDRRRVVVAAASQNWQNLWKYA
jgi:hypothetical protein